MLDKLNAVREKPKDKEKVSKTLFLSLIVLLLASILVILQQNAANFLWLKLKNSMLNDILNSLSYNGLYIALNILILFFIVIKSRKPARAAFFTAAFFIPYFLLLIIDIIKMGISNYLYSLDVGSIVVLSLPIIMVAFNYFLWYGKGKGKFSYFISAVAVGETFGFLGAPIFEVFAHIYWHTMSPKPFEYDTYEYIQIFSACAVCVFFICDVLIMIYNLKKMAKARSKLLIISISVGIVLAALLFSYLLKITPLSTDPPMA